MSSKVRRFYKRSRSSNMFDPQRLLYSSTRTQKKARVLHPKSTSVSASTGLDSSQRNEIFNNIISTRSYIFRPMSSNAKTPWQRYNVYKDTNFVVDSAAGLCSIFSLTDCSLCRDFFHQDSLWTYHFKNLFESFYPNSPFPFILNQIKLRLKIALTDQEGHQIYNDGTSLDFGIPFGIYSKSNGALVEQLTRGSISYIVNEDDADKQELNLEFNLSSQIYNSNDNKVIISALPTQFIAQSHSIETQSTTEEFDITAKPLYRHYLDQISNFMNTYKQFPSTYSEQNSIPLCIANLDILTDNILGFSVVNDDPELDYLPIDCRISLDFSSFAGIPAPRS